MTAVLLLVDIGGTHIRFSAYDGKSATGYARYLIRDFASFETAVRTYVAENNLTLRGMIIGAAGMRLNNVIRLTNCPWVIDAQELQRIFEIEQIVLLNDFSLQGFGVLQCEKDDLKAIGSGEVNPDGFRAVIGAGTGLGICFVVPDADNHYRVIESEAGHTTVSGVTPAMRTVIQKAAEKLPHISFERFVSGTGLIFLYQIIGENYVSWSHDVLSDEIVWMQQAWGFVPISYDADKWQPVTTPPEITALAEQGNEIALMTYWLFFKFLGVFCANMALSVKTTGGVYLVGDLFNHPFVSRLLMDSDLRRAFENKGRFKEFMRQIPIYLVTKKHIPSCGLTYIAKDLWG